jgi:cell division septum initiation protein DivIVA
MIDVDYNEYKATLEDNMRLIKENHKLKEKIKEWQDISTRINEDYRARIDKAIEYIDNHVIISTILNNDTTMCYLRYDDLIKILKGE